jgi:hypothetical protein
VHLEVDGNLKDLTLRRPPLQPHPPGKTQKNNTREEGERQTKQSRTETNTPCTYLLQLTCIPRICPVSADWGIAMNSQDEWITPLKGGIPEIVSSSSVLYKDRAIRTKFKKGNRFVFPWVMGRA